MALVAQNVRVAVTGGIYRAALNTTLPTSATTTAPGGFTDLGYISDEGVTQAVGRDVSDISAWQNGDVVRVVQTSHTVTYSLTFIETNGSVLETAYGNYEDLGGGEGKVELTGDIMPSYAWLIDVIDGTTKIRLALPNGQVTETGDTTFVNGDLISYPVTITAFPDSDGVKAYKYLATAAASS
jgi:hypothetical protein